jgi:predicted RND superfamily exporter protein
MTEPATPDNARAFRYVEWIRRRYAAILTLALLAAVVGVFLASRLELRAQFSELLPEKDPAVVELDRLLKRVGASTLFVVIVEGDHPEKNREFAKLLVEKLQKSPPNTWRSINYETSEARAFFEENGLLYADLEDLVSLKEKLKREIDKKKTGASDLFEDEESLEQLQDRLQAKYQQKLQNQLIFPSGYLESDDLKKLLVLIRPEIDAMGGAETDLIYDIVDEAVNQTEKALDVKKSGIKVSYTGNLPTIIQEKGALKEDLGTASLTCIVLVCLVIGFYFRQKSAVFLIAVPAMLGTLLAFGVAKLTIGYLNSNTAFLGSIILGNGINYAIIFLARYREERLHGAAESKALMHAVALTWKPTLASAVGASTAYGSLMVTQFRGFNQFGLVGCVGMLLCWSLTFFVLPALVFFSEEMRGKRKKSYDTYSDGQVALALPGKSLLQLTKIILRRPTTYLIGAGIIFLVALVPVSRLAHDPFEYDFSKLRNKRALTEGPAFLVKDVEAIFGRQLSPAILAASSPELAEEARQKIIAKDEDRPDHRNCVGNMDTLSDLLPEQQDAKFAVLIEVKKLLDDDALELGDEKLRKNISEAKAKLQKLFVGDTPKPITLNDLPTSIAAPFTEKDGSRGKLLQVSRHPSLVEHNGRDLICFASATTQIPLSDGLVASATGNPAAVFADMITAITRDGPRATLASLCVVMILLWVTFRELRGFVTVLASLFLGVSIMLGIAAAFGMHLNFLNFVAIPITFGIASEYGVNIYERGRHTSISDLPEAVRGTGGAVILCSMTTIIGYGTLLISDNQALNSFGKLAGLGEITTILSSLILVPASLALQRRMANKREARAQNGDQGPVAGS